jgi:hypothetical protein
MRNLNEGKKKAPSYMAELSEIDKQSAIVAMEAKINHLQEMADKKKEKLKMVSEDENLSDLIDPKRKKMMEREIKEIEKAKMKLEKLYEKACGNRPKEMVDEEASKDREDSTLDDAAVGAMGEGYSSPSYEEDDLGEGYSTPSYEEDDTDPMNEEFNRFRKLAGIPLKENISSHKEEAKRFLEKFVDDNKDAFEFTPDMSKGYIDVKDNSYNVDELASVFLDMGQDIPRGKYNQKYEGEGGTYVVVA